MHRELCYKPHSNNSTAAKYQLCISAQNTKTEISKYM